MLYIFSLICFTIPLFTMERTQEKLLNPKAQKMLLKGINEKNKSMIDEAFSQGACSNTEYKNWLPLDLALVTCPEDIGEQLLQYNAQVTPTTRQIALNLGKNKWVELFSSQPSHPPKVNSFDDRKEYD